MESDEQEEAPTIRRSKMDEMSKELIIIITCVAIVFGFIGVIGYMVGYSNGADSNIPSNLTAGVWNFKHNTVTVMISNEQMGYFRDTPTNQSIHWEFSFWRVNRT